MENQRRARIRYALGVLLIVFLGWLIQHFASKPPAQPFGRPTFDGRR